MPIPRAPLRASHCLSPHIGGSIRAPGAAPPRERTRRDDRPSWRAMKTIDPRINCPPAEFRRDRDLPHGFLEFYTPLHAELASRRDALAAKRNETLRIAHAGRLPDH